MSWWDTLGHAPAILVTAGLFIYGYLSICYDQFYSRLGVDPSDVGLSYAGTLARSSGFVVAFLVLTYLVMGGFIAARAFGYQATGKPREGGLRMLGLLGGIVTLGTLAWTPFAAAMSADDVKAGRPVGPVRMIVIPIPLPVLAIHAHPVVVEPAGKVGESPAADRLQGRKLLYIGQSSNTVVLYDGDADRAVYVPASSIILQVANCDATPPPDPSCQQIERYYP